MRKRKTIDVNLIDYLIISNDLTGKEIHSADDSKIIALYDYWGRWFSKSAIMKRIKVIDELRRKGEVNLAYFFMDQSYDNGFWKYYDLEANRAIIRLQMLQKWLISIDSEIMVEINNLCRRGKPSKVNDLLKYITPQIVLDNSLDEDSLWLAFSLFGGYPYPLEELPKDVVSFWWKQDGELNAVCYISNTDNANFIEAFKLDIFEVGRIVTGNGKINKEVHLNNVLSYSGNDYDLMFRLQGETIKCGRPPLIKHNYDLQPIIMLSISQHLSDCHEEIEKYYDLYRLGNKKAKQALKASGFNLDALDD